MERKIHSRSAGVAVRLSASPVAFAHSFPLTAHLSEDRSRAPCLPAVRE